ncbi:MAG: hypothetical protein U9R02_04330 [Thermodesulfobacteriota bacterium]|nr:hypothetical protein [Thermodesulfobacteriota bacterium]
MSAIFARPRIKQETHKIMGVSLSNFTLHETVWPLVTELAGDHPAFGIIVVGILIAAGLSHRLYVRKKNVESVGFILQLGKT